MSASLEATATPAPGCEGRVRTASHRPRRWRAAELLVAQTGWTLHQFRHSALTHLAEADVQLPLPMAARDPARRR